MIKSLSYYNAICYALLLLFLFPLQVAPQVQAQSAAKPKFITKPVKHDSDDPAVWINRQNPAASLLIGTDKNADGALYVFDMQGDIIQNKVIRNLRRPNNVDVAYGLVLNGKPTDIAVTTERHAGRLRLYSLPDMQEVAPGGIRVFQGENGDEHDAPMGIALYKRPSDGKIYAFVSRKSGPTNNTYIWQYLLEDDGSGNVKGTVVRKFGRYSGRQEIEAIAVDEELGYVYYSDELVGVRKYYADPEKGNQELALLATSGFKRDREGIAIYRTKGNKGYLVVSDQFANELHIYTREGTPANPHDHKLLQEVKIEADMTDGIEIVETPVLPHFPNGFLVAMSDNKTFHLYKWEDIAGKELETLPPTNDTSVVPPTLVSPADQANGIPPSTTLSWSAVPGANSYQVQVSTAPAFSSFFYNQVDLKATSAVVAGLAAQTTYYWRVRANRGNTTSNWSPVRSFTTSDARPRPTANGLVGHWKMEPGNGTTLKDDSGYANDATLVGQPDWIPGVAEQALLLDGEDKFATAPDDPSLDINQNITLSVWIRPERRANQYVLHKATNGDTDGYELSLTSAGIILFRFNEATYRETYRVNSEELYPSNGTTWVHVAATYDGTTARLYINGIENRYKTFDAPPPIGTNNLSLGIGGQHDGFRTFEGAIDDARIYNRVLNAAEVLALSRTPLAAPITGITGRASAEQLLTGNVEVYPNPFTHKTNLQFTLPEDGQYLVTLYDAKGALVAEVKQGIATAGILMDVEVDGSGLSSGLYFIRLQTAQGIETLKLILSE